MALVKNGVVHSTPIPTLRLTLCGLPFTPEEYRHSDGAAVREVTCPACLTTLREKGPGQALYDLTRRARVQG